MLRMLNVLLAKTKVVPPPTVRLTVESPVVCVYPEALVVQLLLPLTVIVESLKAKVFVPVAVAYFPQ